MNLRQRRTLKKMSERQLSKLDRCPAEHPEGRGRCGLPEGHRGRHTLLMETGAWGVQFLHDAPAPGEEG